MHVKHKKVLWEAYNELRHEIISFDSSTTNPNRQKIWDWNLLVGIFTVEQGKDLLEELKYLSNLHMQVVNDSYGCLSQELTT